MTPAALLDGQRGFSGITGHFARFTPALVWPAEVPLTRPALRANRSGYGSTKTDAQPSRPGVSQLFVSGRSPTVAGRGCCQDAEDDDQ
jgi:hypothetical protein